MKMRKLLFCLLLAVGVSMLSHGVCSATAPTKNAVRPSEKTYDLDRLKLEKEKHELEKVKYADDLNLEREKIALERYKAWISAVSIVVPLLVGILTAGFGIWSNRQQAGLQREFQERTAQSQFEIKAAELVFSTKSPTGVKNRAMAIKNLFKNRLPPDFVNNFDPDDYVGKHEPAEAKQLLLRLLVENPERKEEIIAHWKRLYPKSTIFSDAAGGEAGWNQSQKGGGSGGDGVFGPLLS